MTTNDFMGYKAIEGIDSTNYVELPRVLFSGLTASSKTAYSKKFALETERPWFDATSELQNLANVHVSNEELWVSGSAETVQIARQGDQLDKLLDSILLERIEQTPEAVVDAWAMPWLWMGNAVRVFVTADKDTRINRCIESSLLIERFSKDEAESLITQKDNFTRRLFYRLYGFDLFKDHENFDLIIDTSGFIPNVGNVNGSEILKKKLAPAIGSAILLASGQIRPEDAHDNLLQSVEQGIIKFNKSKVTI